MDVYHFEELQDAGLNEEEAIHSYTVVICICEDGKLWVSTADQLFNFDGSSTIVGSREWHDESYVAVCEADYLRDETLIHFSSSENEFDIPVSKDEVRALVGLLIAPLLK